MKRLISLLFIASIVLWSVMGTEEGADAADSAPAGLPMASHFRVAIQGKNALLSWADSPLSTKGYAVYRSETAFSLESFPEALRLADIPAGVGSYEDSPTPGKAFFYAVMAIVDDDEVATVFLPTENTTRVAVSIEAGLEPQTVEPSPAAAVEAAPQAPETPAPALALVTPPGTESPPAPASPPPPVEEPVQNTKTESGPEDVSKDGQTALPPEITPVVAAYQPLPPPKAPEAPVRSTPLPSFLYGRGLAEGRTGGRAALSTTEESASPETAKAISTMSGSPDRTGAIPPSIRSLVATSGQRGDEGGFLTESLALVAAGDWSSAATSLHRDLASPLSPTEKAQAHYYLGVALAHAGELRDALFEFLESRAVYPLETKPWIDFVVEELSMEN